MKNIFVIFLFLTLFISEVGVEVLRSHGYDIAIIEMPVEGELETEKTDNLKLEFELQVIPSESPIHNSDLKLGNEYSFSFLLPNPNLELLTPPPKNS